MIHPNLHWLLSFYRTSEIGGALFFGQLARTLEPGPMQSDVTRHFADEAQHARYWTDCMAALGVEPLALGKTYQDRYLAEAGIPANVMEVLAITHVFECRVAGQYGRHRRIRNLEPAIAATLVRILADERGHVRWVRAALTALTPRFGHEAIDAALTRCRAADERVFGALLAEHGERLGELCGSRSCGVS